MRNFKELVIWKQGIELAVKVYNASRFLPREEIYGLRSQITRAVVSISSNIAEGCSRRTDNDFKRFLEIAIGSAFELENDLIICEKLGLIPSEQLGEIFTDLHKEQKQINALINRIG